MPSPINNNKQPPKRRQGEAQVHGQLIISLPCEISNSHTTKTGWNRTFPMKDGGKIEASATTIINIVDIFLYCCIVALVQDAMKIGMVNVAQYKRANGEVIRSYNISVSARAFTEKVCGHHNVGRCVDFLKRFSSYVCIYSSKDEKTVKKVTYLADFEYENNLIEVTIPANQFDAFTASGWIINVRKIRCIKSNVGKALGFYFLKQRAAHYSQFGLFEELKLTGEVKEKRRQLKKALGECLTAEIIPPYTYEDGAVKFPSRVKEVQPK